MSSITELENLIAVALEQRKIAHKRGYRLMARSINHDLRNWTEELAIAKAGA
jgi:hypothetical protein